MTASTRLRALFAAAIGLTLFMALSPKPPSLPIDRFGDKFEHMLAFAVLTLMARLSFPKSTELRIAERLSFFGALIELFQAIPSLHRDCDWRDWVADTLAIVVTMGLLHMAARLGLTGTKRRRA